MATCVPSTEFNCTERSANVSGFPKTGGTFLNSVVSRNLLTSCATSVVGLTVSLIAIRQTGHNLVVLSIAPRFNHHSLFPVVLLGTGEYRSPGAMGLFGLRQQ